MPYVESFWNSTTKASLFSDLSKKTFSRLGKYWRVMESGPACLPFDVLELFTWLERKLNNQVVHGSSSPTPRLESMRIKSHIWWTWKLGWLHSNINAFFLGQAKVIIWGTCFLSRKFRGYVDLHDGQWRKLSWSVRKKGHWRPLKSKIIVEIISVKTNWPVLHCPLPSLLIDCLIIGLMLLS